MTTGRCAQDKVSFYHDRRLARGRRWFEYHCYKGEDSCDATLWHHTHQKTTVLRKLENVDEADVGKMYRVRFEDSFEADVGDDELLTSPREFSRPDYPGESKEDKKYGFLQLNEAGYKEAIESGRYPDPTKYEQLTAYYPEPHKPGWRGASLAEMFPGRYQGIPGDRVPDNLPAGQAKTATNRRRVPHDRGLGQTARQALREVR